MMTAKRKKIERAGWRLVSTEEFLALNAEEKALVETKLALADAVSEKQEKQRLWQGAIAERMKSS